MSYSPGLNNPTAGPIPVTGPLTDAELRASPVPVSGSLTHNNAAPVSSNVGVLAALVNASTPTFIEGNQALLSSDTSGRLRVQGTGDTGSPVPGVASFGSAQNAAGNLEGLRTAASTLNTTTGISASGMVAVFDDVTPTAITENQFGAVRMSTRREVYVQLRDAAGNERGLNIDTGGNAGVSIPALAKLEDSAHASGDAGIMSLAVRNNTLSTTFTDTNGDYSPIAVDSRGALFVIPGTTAVDLGKAEDAVHATGDVGVMALAVRNDGATTTLTNANGDYSPIAVSSAGEIFTVGNRAEDAAHTTGDRGIFILGVRNDAGADSTSANADYSQVSVDSAGNIRNVGNVDHDAVDKGSPVKIGFRASTTNRTRVATGDRADALSDTAGRIVNVLYQVRELADDKTVTLANNTETTIVAAVASTFNDLVEITCTNTGAATLNISLRSTTAGAVRRIIQVPVGSTIPVVFPATLKQAAVNTNWTVQSSSVTGDCSVGVSYVANI